MTRKNALYYLKTSLYRCRVNACFDLVILGLIGVRPARAHTKRSNRILRGKKMRVTQRNVPDWVKHVPNEFKQMMFFAMQQQNSSCTPWGRSNSSSSDVMFNNDLNLHMPNSAPSSSHSSDQSAAVMSSFGQAALFRQSRRAVLPLPAASTPKHDEGKQTAPSEEKHDVDMQLSLKDVDVHMDDGGDDSPVGEMETELLKAHAARKKAPKASAAAPKAKVAAKAAPAPKSKAAMKRPAATLKRPAADASSTAVDMTDVFETLSSCGHLSRGAFTSRAYDSAKRRATAQGMTVEDAKTFARLQFQKAAEMYNQM